MQSKADALRAFFKANQRTGGQVGYWNQAAEYAGTTPGYAKRLFHDHYKGKESKYDYIKRPQEEDKPLKDHIRGALNRKDTYPISELADTFDCSAAKVKKAVKELADHGHNVKIRDGIVIFSKLIEKAPDIKIDIEKLTAGSYKFGIISDNHLGSRYSRLDVLNAMYEIFAKEKVKVVYNAGNWIDGEARFNKHDLLIHGLDNQLRYLLEHYPKHKGITTYYISGDDHEGWYTQREGVDVGKYMMWMAQNDEKLKRHDLVYLGHMEHDVIIKAKRGQTKIRVLHPGGGSAYAYSYAPQKIIESYQGGEKPDILIVGHYHKASYDLIRGVHCIQAGCTEDQTPFMRKKKLAAHLGGWVVEFWTDDVGAVIRIKTEFIPFFDNAYYKKWHYKW